ncbi:unnamed protein product, partial [Pylaiella littoralis]
MAARSSPPQWPADVGRWASEEERVLNMMRTSWWWQPGPVTSFCGCFTIRTGVYLLSLWSMFWGMVYINAEKWRIPAMIQALQKRRETYKDHCTGPIVEQKYKCDETLLSIERGENTLDFWQSAVPACHAVGAFYVLLSLVGWRAGYTNSTALAKLFMMGFPASFAIDVCIAFISHHDETPLYVVVNAVALAYSFKVAWSFYTRLRLAQEANRILAAVEGEGVVGGR